MKHVYTILLLKWLRHTCIFLRRVTQGRTWKPYAGSAQPQPPWHVYIIVWTESTVIVRLVYHVFRYHTSWFRVRPAGRLPAEISSLHVCHRVAYQYHTVQHIVYSMYCRPIVVAGVAATGILIRWRYIMSI